MIGLLIVTHGGLAGEFRAALEHVVGPQSQLEIVSIGPDDDIEARRKDGVKNATIKYELGCLRRAYSIAASPEHRLLAYRPT